MKTSNYIYFMLILLTSQSVIAQVNWNDYNLLAHYPLIKDAHDETGNYDDVTDTNIDYSQGAAYSNGINIGSFDDGCLLNTPTITSLNLENFGFSLEAKFDTVHNKEYPIIIAGDLNRYIMLSFDMWQGDVKLGMKKNYGEINIISDTLLSIDQWYRIDFKHFNNTSYVYLNDVLLIKHEGALNFNGLEDNQTTKVLTNSHSGESRTFRGFWKDLKIYSGEPSSINDNVYLMDVFIYPNPTQNDLLVKVDGINTIYSYQIVDAIGRGVLSEIIPSEVNGFSINVSHLQIGLYKILLKYKDGKISYSSFQKT